MTDEMRDDPITDGGSLVAVVLDKAGYCPTTPYDPSEIYPEYPFPTRPVGRVDNPAYRAVRQALATLGLDAARFGTAEWNPLGGIVPRGGTVVIKPNLVIDRHYGGGDLYSIITHPSVVRAVADYCRIALGGSGRIVVADAPVEDCDFDHLLAETGLEKVAEVFRAAGGVSLDIRDLRRFETLPGERMYSFKRRPLAGDPLGDVIFDLGERSALFGKPGPFFGADPDTKETRENHHQNIHRYCVAKTILCCDALISVPKLKVHKKVGVTLNLKGLVGINTNKNYLVHYTLGTPRSGGDETPESATLSDSALLRAHHLIHNIFFNSRYPVLARVHHALFHSAAYVAARNLLRKIGLRQSPETAAADGGNWYGNDSCWRMVADLVRIAFYGDPQGRLAAAPQRRIFSLVDGLIGGDRNGPLRPRARASGVIVAGADPGAVDVVCARTMGFDPLQLPLYRWLTNSADHRLCPPLETIRVVGNAAAVANHLLEPGPGLGFEPHPNWAGHLPAPPNPVARPGEARLEPPSPPPATASATPTASDGPRPPGQALRVCQVAASLDTGGMERVVCDILRELAKAGHKPYLFCTDGRGALFEAATAVAKQATTRRPTPWVIDFRVVTALSAFVRQHRIDVIHAHNQPAQLYAALVGRWTGRPVVVTIHGQGFTETPRAVRLRRILTRFADRLVAVSQDTRQSLVDKRIATADRVRIISNGVDVVKFAPPSGAVETERTPAGAAALPRAALVIGTVGRLAPEKNYPLLVRAFARLLAATPPVPGASAFPGCFLVIVGDGADRPRLEKEIESCGIRASCLITGLQKDVGWWLRRLQVFCLSSDTEGMPITLLEAGACGLPSVVTDVGGNHEVVENGVTGLLVPAGDEAGLANALRALAGDAALRRRMGDAARKRIADVYPLDKMIRQYILIYQEVRQRAER